MYQFGVNLRLISGDTVPFVRQLVRTYSQSSLNRIDLVKSKLQHRYGVTTKAVGVVMEVDTRIADRLAVPYIAVTLIALDSQIRGIRIEYVQG